MATDSGRSTPPAWPWLALSAGFGLGADEYLYILLTMRVWWPLAVVGVAVVVAGACAAVCGHYRG